MIRDALKVGAIAVTGYVVGTVIEEKFDLRNKAVKKLQMWSDKLEAYNENEEEIENK